ncbi:MAG: PQQ-binding-like beta-propeller repeat protein [Ilumatobacter sp.]|uniref:PQQ-binding-like beta-propeller repeat protein n=1 Tax=Ilumatobacter sp. TaxID=1967498 RepID=UPI00260220E6|nr:PQQ-binding-like beta-propeller repeat protein [Ilumatobacter sp.]MDJ0770322.1 PQQ-binding-like beta-propeller repeat protein [Ilumatobacter sp.]
MGAGAADPDAAWRPDDERLDAREADERSTRAGEPAAAAADDPDAPWRRDYDGPPPTVQAAARPPADSHLDGIGAEWARSERRAPAETPVEPLAEEPAVDESAGLEGPGAGEAPEPARGKAPDDAVGEVAAAAGDRTRARPPWRALVPVVAVLAVGIVATIVIARDPADSHADLAPLLPDAAAAQWDQVIDGRIHGVAVAGDVVVVVSDTGAILGLDRTDGRVRWADDFGTPRTVDSLAVIDELVAVTDTMRDETTRIHVLDAASGELRWRQASTTGRYWAFERWVWRIDAFAGRQAFRLLDPASGDAVGEPVVGSISAPLSGGDPVFVGDVDGKVGLHDLDTGDLLAGPVDGSDLTWVVMLDDVIAGLTANGDLVSFDATGRRADTVDAVRDVAGRVGVRPRLYMPPPGEEIALVSAESSLGFSVDDGSIEVEWEAEGWVQEPVVTDRGVLAVARVEGTSGGDDRSIIDVSTGETLLVTDVGVTFESDPLIGRNGYLVTPEFGAAERRLRGFGFDGDEWWSVPLPGASQFVVGDGLVVVHGRNDRSSSVVTVYG